MSIVQSLLKSRGPSEFDPFYSDVVFLAGFESSLNEDKTGRVATPNNAVRSTARSRYGLASLLRSGSNSNGASYPATGDLALGTSDFTIELSHWVSSIPGNSTILSLGNWRFYWSQSATAQLVFEHIGVASATTSSVSPLSAGVWNDIAVVRSAGIVSIYVNGTRLIQDFVTGNLTSSGVLQALGVDNQEANLDEIRITRNVARYTGASYTVRTDPFPRQ